MSQSESITETAQKDTEIAENQKLWIDLYADVAKDETFPAKTPLLAHYCSTATLEAIVRHEQLWFSNPLFMNDHEELRFGVQRGMEAFHQSEEVKQALGPAERYEILRNSMLAEFARFDSERALVIFAVCFSDHTDVDDDGLLSMWRGYGDHGNGAAIVFDTSKLKHLEGSPLIVARVTYGTAAERVDHLRRIMVACATSLAELNLRDERLPDAANMLFQRILIFALFTKHKGFHEEREWRVVYLPHHDTEQRLTGSISYHIGPSGVQPKLKFKIAPIDEVAGEHVTLSNLVHKIILGPTGIAPLKMASTQMMLKQIGKPELADRVVISGTPFRPT
ncbi:UNVERIFIED_ORG: hypothetical protein ABIC54_004242 [Burkholderia sp. 1263]